MSDERYTHGAIDERAAAIDMAKMAALGYPDVTFVEFGPATFKPVAGVPEAYTVRQGAGRVVYVYDRASDSYKSAVRWAAARLLEKETDTKGPNG